MGRLLDLTDKKFGKLTVVRRMLGETYINGEALWECICSCEKKSTILAHGSQLRGGRKKSCGCIRAPSEYEYLCKIKQKLLEKSKLNIYNQCIEWTGFKNHDGYGQISYTKKGIERAIGAHRASWMVHVGPIPNDLYVLHKCDNPCCVRIEHLWLGNDADNMRDKINKGRGNHKRGSKSPVAKLSEKKAKEILHMKGQGKTSHELSKEYGIAASSIRSIWQRKNWKHLKEK